MQNLKYIFSFFKQLLYIFQASKFYLMKESPRKILINKIVNCVKSSLDHYERIENE